MQGRKVVLCKADSTLEPWVSVLKHLQKCIYEYVEFNNWGWHNRHFSLPYLQFPQSKTHSITPGQPYAFRQAGL